MAENTYRLPRVDGEGDVLEGLKYFGATRTRVQQALLQGLVALVVNFEGLIDAFDADHGSHLQLRFKVAFEATEDR